LKVVHADIPVVVDRLGAPVTVEAKDELSYGEEDVLVEEEIDELTHSQVILSSLQEHKLPQISKKGLNSEWCEVYLKFDSAKSAL
jgi:hypothetical protein